MRYIDEFRNKKLRRFGLTPGDRDRIEIPEDEDKGQSLADILMGHITKESQPYADADFNV